MDSLTPIREEHKCLTVGMTVKLFPEFYRRWSMAKGVGRIVGFSNDFVHVDYERYTRSGTEKGFPFLFPREIYVIKRIGQLHFMFN